MHVIRTESSVAVPFPATSREHNPTRSCSGCCQGCVEVEYRTRRTPQAKRPLLGRDGLKAPWRPGSQGDQIPWLEVLSKMSKMPRCKDDYIDVRRYSWPDLRDPQDDGRSTIVCGGRFIEDILFEKPRIHTTAQYPSLVLVLHSFS